MKFLELVAQMERTAMEIKFLVEPLDEVQGKWKPTPDSWSVLEVVNHLCDEEREDFRTRLDYILHKPAEQAPSIDPEGWVTARKYNERNLSESLINFLEERKRSIQWLHKLGNPNFDAAAEGPFGRMTAGDMFTAWATHDLYHLRQIIEIKYAYAIRLAAPFVSDYAGKW